MTVRADEENIITDIKEWENYSTPVMVVNLHKDEPVIIRANTATSALLGYLKEETENCELHKLLPPLARGLAWRAGAAIPVFLIHKNGFAVKCEASVHPVNSLALGSILIISLKRISTEKEVHFLINPRGRIEALTSTALSILGLQHKPEEEMFNIYPQFFRREKPALATRQFLLNELMAVESPEDWVDLQLKVTTVFEEYTSEGQVLGYALAIHLGDSPDPMIVVPSPKPRFKFRFTQFKEHMLIQGDAFDRNFEAHNLDLNEIAKQVIELKSEEESEEDNAEGIKIVRLKEGQIKYIA